MADVSACSSGSSQEATQVNSQPAESAQIIIPSHCWGILSPIPAGLEPIELPLNARRVVIGRDKGVCTVLIRDKAITGQHVELNWDGVSDNTSVTTIRDLKSKNGTYVNSERLDDKSVFVLRDGAEVCFSLKSPNSRTKSLGEKVYQYIFRFKASHEHPNNGVWAHYDIAKELGSGSYAVVCKAAEKKTGSIVAIKMIKKRSVHENDSKEPLKLDKLIDTDSSRRIRVATKEARLVSQINHPNVVRVRSVYCESEKSVGSKYSCYIVMDFIENGDLMEYIGMGLDELTTKQIAWQIFQAVSFFHERGIAHRDLKAENILLTRDVPPVVKIADFGLSKLETSESYLKTRCGTAAYAAPEIFDDDLRDSSENSGYSSKVDCFSIGVLMHCMLTTEFPFELPPSSQPPTVEYYQMRRLTWHHLNDTQFSHHVKNLIESLLCRSPMDRISSAGALNHAWFFGYVPPEKHLIPEVQEHRPSLEVYSINDDGEPILLEGSSELESPEITLASQISGLSVENDGAVEAGVVQQPKEHSPKLFNLPEVRRGEGPVRQRRDVEVMGSSSRSVENMVVPQPIGSKRGREGSSGGVQSPMEKRRKLFGKDANDSH